MTFSPRLGTCPSSGFTLLEILVSLLILSIGLLGFASLMLSGLSDNQGAYLRSQATNIAYDFASRMKANHDYVNWDSRAPQRGDGAQLSVAQLGGNAYSGDTLGAVRELNPDDEVIGSNYCGAAPADVVGDKFSQINRANSDVFEVCVAAMNTLPMGVVRIRCNSRNFRPEMDSPYRTGVKHRVFSNNPAVVKLAEDTSVNDVCSPGSSYTIAVSWTAPAARRDVGAREREYADAADYAAKEPRCSAMGVPSSQACITLDIIP